jgi:Tol biopolymer transport system component
MFCREKRPGSAIRVLWGPGVTNYPGRDQDADWAPDGRTIAFERDAEPIANLTVQVFVMNADGTDPTQLTGSSSRPTQAKTAIRAGPKALRLSGRRSS